MNMGTETKGLSMEEVFREMEEMDDDMDIVVWLPAGAKEEKDG